MPPLLPIDDIDLEELSISKEVLQELPEDFKETSLGEIRDAIRQYRGPCGLHVREYDDRFVIHRDIADPRKDPIGHLLFDAPETSLALTTALCVARRRRRNSLAGIHDKEKYHARAMPGPFFILSTFLSLNYLFKFLKRVLF